MPRRGRAFFAELGSGSPPNLRQIGKSRSISRFRRNGTCSSNRLFGALIPVLVLGAMLGACSDIYYDRRETVSLQAGNTQASNIIAQTVDPWPPAAGNRNIGGNGERMQKAAERYRTNKVTPLATTSTSSVQYSPGSSLQSAPSGAPSP